MPCRGARVVPCVFALALACEQPEDRLRGEVRAAETSAALTRACAQDLHRAAARDRARVTRALAMKPGENRSGGASTAAIRAELLGRIESARADAAAAAAFARSAGDPVAAERARRLSARSAATAEALCAAADAVAPELATR